MTRTLGATPLALALPCQIELALRPLESKLEQKPTGLVNVGLALSTFNEPTQTLFTSLLDEACLLWVLILMACSMVFEGNSPRLSTTLGRLV